MRIGDADIISFHGSRRPVYLDILVEARDIYALWPKPKPSAVKAAAAAEEGRCRAALVLRMRAAATTPVPKRLVRGEFPQLGRRAFERAYTGAAEEANAPAWRAPGRRKSPHQKSPRQINRDGYLQIVSAANIFRRRLRRHWLGRNPQDDY
jgi:hypothetical protein